MTCLALSSTPAAPQNNDTAIRPFRVKVPEADVADLRRRLAATRWPDKETVADGTRSIRSISKSWLDTVPGAVD
jgi:hypothetical protein